MKNAQAVNNNLSTLVGKNTSMKEYLIEYVGDYLKPKNGEVTTEMIVEVMAKEFPEFLLSIAEENFIRGYEQALNDVELEESSNKKKKKR